MSANKSNIKEFIFGIILIIIIGYFGWLIVTFFIDLMIKVDEKTSATIIASMLTILSGLTAVIITQRQIKLREIAEAHREKKIAIYNDFITTATSLVAGRNNNIGIEAPNEQELIMKMFHFKKDILLWGSPKVIKAQLKFEEVVEQGPKFVLTSVDNIYKAMREDIGLSNSGLNDHELIKLFLSDPKEMDKLISSNKTQEPI